MRMITNTCRFALLHVFLLLALLALCPSARAQSPNVSPNIFDPTLAPYNADKTGASDAAVKINQAVSDAVNWGNANSAPAVVSLPAGKYLLQSGSINISYAHNNVTLTGHSSGDTFLLYTKAQNTVTNLFEDTNAAHTVTVTLQNFTEDASDPSQFGYTQGTITAIDPAANSATLQVESGYPLLNRSDFVSDAAQGFSDTFSSALYTFSDPKRPIWDHPQGLMQSLAPSADGTTATVTMMPYYRLPAFVHVGSRFAILDMPNHVANTMILDDNVTYQNINYYGGLDMEADGASEYVHGNLTFTNYYQGPPPAPAEATAARPATFLPDRLVTAEEGFQMEAYGTTSFINCDLSGGWDDVLDLGGGFAKVLTLPSGTQTTQVHTDGGCRFFQPGDIAELSRGDSTGTVYVSSDQVTAAQTQSDGSCILTFATAIPSASVQVGDLCTDRSCAGPIVLRNSSFSSMNGHVFLKCGGLTNPGILVTGCTLHDMSDNGLEVVGAPSYEQGPLEARNVLIQNNLFKNCQNVGCLIEEGTAVTGSNVQILNNTFLDTGSETFESSNGPAIVLDNVNGATISGNWFDRNWGANVCAEYDDNLVITNNTFNHPNFIRPALAAPYTNQPTGSGDWILPDPSSVVFLANDAGVTLSGNLVNGAGAYTRYLTEVDTGVTSATGLADGITQIDSPLAFYLAYDKLVMDQPASGTILDQAAWTGAATQKWIGNSPQSNPGFLTLTDDSNGQSVGNGNSQALRASIDIESQAWTLNTDNPATDQMWNFAVTSASANNVLNDLSAYDINVGMTSKAAGAKLLQWYPDAYFKSKGQSSQVNQDFIVLNPPAPLVKGGFENACLTWAPVPGATGYTISRSTAAAGPFTSVGSVGTTLSLAFTDTTAAPGIPYYYTVAATGTPLGTLASTPAAVSVGTTATNVPVNLAPDYDVTGIEPDAWTYLGPGFDGYGYTYSAAQVPASLFSKGVLFSLGVAAKPDAVSDQGQRIVLPPGNFSSLQFLGAYLGTSPGSTGTFAPTITYADNTSAVLSQGMTNWCGSASQPGEADAASFSYRNFGNGTNQSLTCYLHQYQIAIDPTRTVQWLDLPDTGNVRLMAMTLTAQASALAPGASLTQSQYITSPAGAYFLYQQTDGDLALFRATGEGAPGPGNGTRVWDSGYHALTPGSFYTLMQADGNLVTYAGTPTVPGGPVWSSQTYSPHDYLQVTDQGQAQILNDNAVVWSNGVNMQASSLAQGGFLTTGETLTSPSGVCYLVQQNDGNLVLYNGTPANPGSYIWASANYQAQGSYFLAMQTDGNLVTYAGSPGVPGGYEWASQTYGNPNTYLTVTDTKEVQLISNGNVIWQRP